MKKSLIIGAAILDIILEIPRLPQQGEDIYASEQTMSVGGCAYNVASILNNFEVPYTLFAPVGNGTYGSIIEETLLEQGHEITILSDHMDNGYCLCLVDGTGERTFITTPGIECQFEQQWFNRINPAEYEQVYISGYEIEGIGGDTILDFLEAHPHLTIYFAPGPRITYLHNERLARMLALHPIVHLNDREAIDYVQTENLEDCAKAITATTSAPVIITLGPNGVLLLEEQEVQYVSGTKANLVDTIGAGDSHIGTILSMQSKNYSLAESCLVANRVAAAVVSIKGSILPKASFQIDQFMK